jgi:acetoacetyl-CoA reductase
VTGGSRGIGRAIAVELAKLGCGVAISYREQGERAEAVVKELEGEGATALCLQADVSDPAQAKTLVAQTIDRLGQVDILVNNAGITRDVTVRKMTDEDWHDVIGTNLNGTFYVTRALVGHLTARKAPGRIINVSSIIGQTGNVGQANYAASKAGIIGFTKALALELARVGVTVNAVCPGFIDTDMLAKVPNEIRETIERRIPAQRFGRPEEVARAVAFLATEGGYVTGQCLNVNGAMYV